MVRRDNLENVLHLLEVEAHLVEENLVLFLGERILVELAEHDLRVQVEVGLEVGLALGLGADVDDLEEVLVLEDLHLEDLVLVDDLVLVRREGDRLGESVEVLELVLQ